MEKKLATQRVSVDIADGTTMNAYVARPAEEGKFPGMMVFQEAFGVNAHLRDVTERVAREGYVAVAPELFHRTAPGFEASYANFQSTMPHMQAITEAGASKDIEATYDWLRTHPQVAEDRIGSIGFCLGGRMSYLADSVVNLRAAISFYGGRIAPDLLPRAANLSAPILFFWGVLDQHIPPDQIRAVVEEVKKANKPYVNVEISNADHGFFCDARGSYNPVAATLAWTLSLQFLDIHLRGSERKTQTA
jgi:carboxymethylenebutenolidase